MIYEYHKQQPNGNVNLLWDKCAELLSVSQIIVSSERSTVIIYLGEGEGCEA